MVEMRHLGSKRGVMRGVGPIIREESSMLLAGVTKGFLVDLNPDRRVSSTFIGPLHLREGVEKNRKEKKRDQPSDGGALLADRQRLCSF